MLVDARILPEGFVAEADICIVGAGAAGITIARDLRDSRGAWPSWRVVGLRLIR